MLQASCPACCLVRLGPASAETPRFGEVILASGFTLCYCGLAVQKLPLQESFSLSIGRKDNSCRALASSRVLRSEFAFDAGERTTGTHLGSEKTILFEELKFFCKKSTNKALPCKLVRLDLTKPCWVE